MTNWYRCHAKRSFLVPPKVRFVAMTMFGQALDIVHLTCWERSFLVPRKVRFLAMTMFEQARHCSFGLTKTFVNGLVRLKLTRLCGFGACLRLAGRVWFRQPKPWQP